MPGATEGSGIKSNVPTERYCGGKGGLLYIIMVVLVMAVQPIHSYLQKYGTA